jgi:hypothetical protein
MRGTCHNPRLAEARTMNRPLRLTLWATLAVAFAATGCGSCGAGFAPNMSEIPLAIAVHPTTTLSPKEANDVTRDASLILQSSDWPGDTACPVELTVESLGTFEIGNGIVGSKFDFDKLFPAALAPGFTAGAATAPQVRTRHVRVVSQIFWCDVFIASAAGCADQPGLRIAVARRGADREGELWAHEVGHTRGLPHRNSWSAVMFEAILPDHKDLTALECTTYRW